MSTSHRKNTIVILGTGATIGSGYTCCRQDHFQEAVVEETFIASLGNLSWTVDHESDIAPI